VDAFESFPEQAEAKRLLRAALAEGPAHAYLFHGPPGVGKRAAALAFAGQLIGRSEPAARAEAGRPPSGVAESTPRDRVLRGTHPDVYLLEPVGDQIRIDDIRELRRDLHMRPFEADRRVYLVHAAETMNEDAADALLKDLEEPPPYAVIVLVADDLGPLPETILSRCQLVPFTRLSERAVREEIAARAPGLEPAEAAALARLAAGRLDRAARLLDPKAANRREALLEVARSVYADPDFDPRDAAQRILDGARERAADAKDAAEQALELLDLPAREAEQRVRRAARGAERDELLAALEELASWYRDLVVTAVGAERAVVHADRLAVLAEDGTTERLAGAERACEIVRETWRAFEEFNLSPPLALEALFVRLRRELGSVPSLA
jgi:DNA polymerase III subunit delta'